MVISILNRYKNVRRISSVFTESFKSTFRAFSSKGIISLAAPLPHQDEGGSGTCSGAAYGITNISQIVSLAGPYIMDFCDKWLPHSAVCGLRCPGIFHVSEPGYMSKKKNEKIQRINSIRKTNKILTHVTHNSRAAVYTCHINQNCRSFHVENLSVLNFRFYCSCIRGQRRLFSVAPRGTAPS